LLHNSNAHHDLPRVTHQMMQLSAIRISLKPDRYPHPVSASTPRRSPACYLRPNAPRSPRVDPCARGMCAAQDVVVVDAASTPCATSTATPES
jgi:hypothetical protein